MIFEILLIVGFIGAFICGFISVLLFADAHTNNKYRNTRNLFILLTSICIIMACASNYYRYSYEIKTINITSKSYSTSLYAPSQCIYLDDKYNEYYIDSSIDFGCNDLTKQTYLVKVRLNHDTNTYDIIRVYHNLSVGDI